MALLRGTLELLVLKSLSWGAMHGFEIISWIDERSGGELEVTDAALLQALHRLEGREAVTSDWGVTSNGRRAKYYRLTLEGQAVLRDEGRAMARHVEALATVLAARTLEP
jgi:DNA-binding PadR family transcriptional regulator